MHSVAGRVTEYAEAAIRVESRTILMRCFVAGLAVGRLDVPIVNFGRWRKNP